MAGPNDPRPAAGAVSLRPVTRDTVRAITGLRVAPAQEGYVASNAVSIAEAYFHTAAWFRAIYSGESPAGFVMLEDPALDPGSPPGGELSLWRFMVDARFQRSGVGRQALTLVIAHARTRPGVGAVHTSYVVGPQSPVGFYLAFGFEPTGKIKPNGEVELVYPLQRPA